MIGIYLLTSLLRRTESESCSVHVSMVTSGEGGVIGRSAHQLREG